MKRFSLYLFLFFTNLVMAQNTNEPLAILIQFDSQNKPFLQHQVIKGQTLFSIRSKFGLSESEIKLYNPQVKDGRIQIGQWLIIPIGHLLSYETNPQLSNSYCPAYYVVQTQDNLYSIAKKRSQWNVQTLMKQNKLKSTEIKPEQLIKIAYLIKLDQPKTMVQEVDQEGKINVDENSDTTQAESKSSNTDAIIRNQIYSKEERGVAYCIQNVSNNNSKYYALYNQAKKGSQIEIYNPVLERFVNAKVIGKIPKNFTQDIKVVVSKEVAHEIGALGDKFFVYVRH